MVCRGLSAISALISPDVCAHGDYHSVVRELLSAVEDSPDDPELRFRLATAHVRHGEWLDGLVELERTDRLAPGHYPTDYFRGMALATGKKWELARFALDDFLAGEPNHAEALSERGRVLLELRETEAAIGDIRAALRLSAGLGYDFYKVAAEALLRHREANEAVDVVKLGIQRLGPNPDLLTCGIDCATAADQFDLALHYVDHLQQMWPLPEPWMARRAQLLTRAGRSEDARAAWVRLREHVLALPNLERGQPFRQELLREANKALGIDAPVMVVAPPAPR